MPFSFFSISCCLSYPHLSFALFSSHPLPCDHYTSIRGCWCSVKPVAFKVRVTISVSFSVCLFLNSVLSPFPLHLHVSLILSSSFPLCERLSLSLSVCRVYFLSSLEEWNFLKFYQRRSAFSPNTLHPGYWRLQHGLLLCATLICELYQGIKHKPAALSNTVSQLGAKELEEIVQ